MSLRVLWLIDSLGPGGAEGLMPSLLERLSARGVIARVCVLRSRLGNPVSDELIKKNIPVDMIRIKNLRDIRQIVKLFRYIKGLGVDVVHTQTETSDILGGFMSRLLGMPNVSTLHTLSAPSVKKNSRLRKWIREFSLKYFFDAVIAVSEVTKQHHVGLGINSEKIHTLYNGIDLGRFNAGRVTSEEKRRLGIHPEEKVVTTVAVLREAKGLQFMLNALPLVLRSYPRLRYVIAGDGKYRDALEKLANSLHLEDHVVFLGHTVDVPQVLAASDLFVFPTLNDALPTALLEAMAAGMPIIASEVGGVPEIIQHRRNGFLIPPMDHSVLADACIYLLSNPQLSNEFRANARRDVFEKFNIDKQADSLIDLYRQILSGKR
jgi:glycosyltransferase involved in cell wall biosynthesis